MTISTPTNPTATAVQRRMPTTSPNIGTDNAVISSGETNPTEAASASGMWRSASIKHSAEATSPRPRQIWAPGTATCQGRIFAWAQNIAAIATKMM